MTKGRITSVLIGLAAIGLAGAGQGQGMGQTEHLNRDRDEEIARATTAVKAAIPAAEADPDRPAFHFHAPAQWMNDPNGPIYADGWFHIFYQFNPYGDQWGHMHWGHARSRDLVNWEHLPIALWPSLSAGENHVFSGSSFRDGKGRPVIFYTSIGDGRDPEQWAAQPEDGDLIRWRKAPGDPALKMGVDGIPHLAEWRDPFLLADGGKTYLVTGGGENGRGAVFLYEATDPELTGWKYDGVLFRHPDADVPNIECPNIAKIGDRWVLLVSVHGRVESFVGRLEGGKLHAESRGVLNEGSYASQLIHDPHGRLIDWAWVQMSNHHGWNGCLTLPSVLSLASDGTLRRQPARELQTLRDHKIEVKPGALAGTEKIGEGDLLEVVADLDPGQASSVGLKWGAATVGYDPRTRTLSTTGREPVVLPESTGKDLKLHVFLDRTVVDVYAGDGAVTQTTQIAHDKLGGLELFAEGGIATIRSLSVYTLKPARFDLSHFR